MYAIGIDIGTTSICGIVLDTDTGTVVRSCTRESNAFIKTDNLWEKIQDTDKLICLAKEILDSFLCEYQAAVIGLTGQMHGIVYVNAGGQAVSPLYIWQDGRGNLPYQDTTYAQYLGSHSGYGNVTDFYNRHNRLRPQAAVAHCTIMDYLGMVLCGLNQPVMHTTNAASLGCFDLHTLRFSYENDVTVTDRFQIIGHYRNIPVSVAIGDNQASVFSTLPDEEDLLLNVGTGSQVSLISDTVKTGPDIETRPYFDGKYLVVGAALCGGRAYGILKDFYASLFLAAGLTDEDIYGLMGKLLVDAWPSLGTDQTWAAALTPAATLTVDTRFAGTRSNPSLTGSITGITEESFTPANLTCGVLTGMMTELFTMYTQMQACHKNLVGSGNGIRLNPALARIAETVFGGRLQIPAHTEEAAYGAALFGLVACGAKESAADAQQLVHFKK